MGGGEAGQDKARIREHYRRTWDLVLHMVHPTALYVLLQLGVLGHLGQSPLLSGARGYGLLWYGVFACQFLGAWAVFASTLLRDAGIRNRTALALVGLAAGVLAAQVLLFPRPSALTAPWAWVFLAAHCIPALLLWGATMAAWRRWRRRLAHLIQEGDGGNEGGGT